MFLLLWYYIYGRRSLGYLFCCRFLVWVAPSILLVSEPLVCCHSCGMFYIYCVGCKGDLWVWVGRERYFEYNWIFILYLIHLATHGPIPPPSCFEGAYTALLFRLLSLLFRALFVTLLNFFFFFPSIDSLELSFVVVFWVLSSSTEE